MASLVFSVEKVRKNMFTLAKGLKLKRHSNLIFVSLQQNTSETLYAFDEVGI